MKRIIEPIEPIEDVLTCDEAARFLGLADRRLLDRLAQAGEGPPHYRYSSRRKMYPRTDLLAWRDAQKFIPRK